MSKSDQFTYSDEMLAPETRPELLERLRLQARAARRNSAKRPESRGEGKSPKNLPYVSPMRRGETVNPAQNPSAQASASVPSPSHQATSWIQNMQDPQTLQSVWKNPSFRKGLMNIVTFGAFFLVVFLLITMGQSEPVADDAELAAAAEESEQETPAVTVTSSEQTTKTVSEEPVVEKTTSKPKTSQVTVEVQSPSRVTIEIDGSVYPNTEKVTLPLTVGSHQLRITKDGYEAYESTFEVADIARQTLPGVTLAAVASPVKPEPASRQVQVVSTPANAVILAEGEPTGYTTPALLPAELAKGSVSVKLDGYVIRDVVSERSPSGDTIKFSLERIATPSAPAITAPSAIYGFRLNEAENRSLVSALDKMLNADWNTSQEIAVSDAKNHLNVWGPFTKWDPRLDHAYGLVLWHHGEFKKAKEAMMAGVKREKTRSGQVVPYYPLYRDMIRLESVTHDEELAVEDLLDLIRDTAKTLKRHPELARDEAIENADFAGRMLGFLEGPSRAKLSDAVNLRMRSSQIERTLPDEELRGTYQSARSDVQDQFQEEVQIANNQKLARDQKEKDLQDSGQLGTTQVRASENRYGGKYERSDHNAQNVTPFRIPDVTSAFTTDRGGVGVSRGPAIIPFNNLLFASGPSIARSFVNNRTNDTTKVTRRVELEELPNITFRRPHSLNTYMPQELERKRRDLLESVSVAESVE